MRAYRADVSRRRLAREWLGVQGKEILTEHRGEVFIADETKEDIIVRWCELALETPKRSLASRGQLPPYVRKLRCYRRQAMRIQLKTDKWRLSLLEARRRVRCLLQF